MGLLEQHLPFSWSCKLLTPVPPCGSKRNCSAVETASLLNHLSACQYSVKICLRVICAHEICLEVVEWCVMADSVLVLYHFRVLLCCRSLSPIILFFKMYIHSLKAWTAERADRCPLWHRCHPYFFISSSFTWPLSTLSLKVCCYDNCLAGEVAVFILCNCVRASTVADRQSDSCPCWILLSPPGEAERGMNKLTTDCVCCQ